MAGERRRGRRSRCTCRPASSPPAPGRPGSSAWSSWATILSVSSESTTRSGFFAAIASAFGLNAGQVGLRRVGRVVRLVVDRDDLRPGADREQHLGRGRRQRDDLRRVAGSSVTAPTVTGYGRGRRWRWRRLGGAGIAAGAAGEQQRGGRDARRASARFIGSSCRSRLGASPTGAAEGRPSARRPSSRALIRDRRAGDLAQLPGVRGASQLRDSAGFTPASLRRGHTDAISGVPVITAQPRSSCRESRPAGASRRRLGGRASSPASAARSRSFSTRRGELRPSQHEQCSGAIGSFSATRCAAAGPRVRTEHHRRTGSADERARPERQCVPNLTATRLTLTSGPGSHRRPRTTRTNRRLAATTRRPRAGTSETAATLSTIRTDRPAAANRAPNPRRPRRPRGCRRSARPADHAEHRGRGPHADPAVRRWRRPAVERPSSAARSSRPTLPGPARCCGSLAPRSASGIGGLSYSRTIS